MHAPMLMAWGAYFADTEVNFVDAYFTSTSGWDSVDSDGTVGSNLTFGETDQDGDSNAVLIDFVGDNNHHIWYSLPSSLTEGGAYTLTAYFKQGPNGFTDTIQMAYYSGGDTVADTEVSATTAWEQYEFSFIAGEDVNNGPSVRLIGWGNGSDGDNLYVGKIRLAPKEIEGDGEEILTDNTMYDGSAWQFISGHDVTYGVTDSQGGSTAARATLIGADTHHIEHDLSEPLVAGRAYTISVRFQGGPNGFPDTFQLAYYDTNGSVVGTDVAVPATWDVVRFGFICPSHDGTNPRIRLLGFSNGSDGDEVEIDYVSLVEGSETPI